MALGGRRHGSLHEQLERRWALWVAPAAADARRLRHAFHGHGRRDRRARSDHPRAAVCGRRTTSWRSRSPGPRRSSCWRPSGPRSSMAWPRRRSRSSCGRQRDDLQRRKEELRAQNLRFDMALSNMAHGLCMVDGEQRLVVCNKRYAEMYRIPAELTRPGTPLSGHPRPAGRRAACKRPCDAEDLHAREALASHSSASVRIDD